MAIAGEALEFQGTVPAKAQRVVVLQRRAQPWADVIRVKTDARGSFSFSAPNKWAFDISTHPVGSTQFRVWAPAVNQRGRQQPSVTSGIRVVRTVGQKVALTMPPFSAADTVITAAVVASPPRAGRVLSLQRQAGASWTTVKVGRQGVTGNASWTLRNPVGGAVHQYRVVVSALDGAPAVAGPAVRVESREPAQDQLIDARGACRDVVFIGARGSGQQWVSRHGLGDEVGLAYGAYRDELPGDLSTAFYPIPYPATASDAPRLIASSAYREEFFSSIDTGVDMVLAFLLARHVKCGDVGERYVLGGYSQGAMVMHRAINARGPAGLDAEFAAVDGALAISDGDRLASQGGHVYGTAPSSDSRGIGVAMHDLGFPGRSYQVSTAPIVVTTGFSPDRFHSVCMVYDVVCDFDANLSEAIPGVEIHTTAYRDTATGSFAASGVPSVEKAVKAIAAETMARSGYDPDPGAGLTPPDAVAGQPYHAQLAVPDGRPGTWQLVGQVPTGLTVSSSGSMTALAGFAGAPSFTVAFTDRLGRTENHEISIGFVSEPWLMIGPCEGPAEHLCTPPHNDPDDIVVISGLDLGGGGHRNHPHRVQVLVNDVPVYDEIIGPEAIGGGYIRSMERGCVSLTVIYDTLYPYSRLLHPPGMTC